MPHACILEATKQKMASSCTPGRTDAKSKLMDLKERLERCWKLNLDWSLYPEHIKKVCAQADFDLASIN